MRPLLMFALMFFSLEVAPAVPASSSAATATPFLYTTAKSYNALAWLNGGERFPSGAAIFIHDQQGSHPLLPHFAVSADPAVSFDGQQVLFAGKRTLNDHWQIWTMALEGGEPRRITNCSDDCIRPLYLHDDRIVYSERIASRYVILATALDGGKPMPLTYWPASSLATDVLLDGRILFESRFAAGAHAIPELYTVYSDGSGVESYRCDHGKSRHQGKQVTSGDIVFSTEGRLARFTSARATQLLLSAPAGDFAGDVAETGTGEWLLPWRPDRSSTFQLMTWKPGQSALGALLKETGMHLLQPTLITEHAIPKRHPSGLHDWPVGNLLCLNAYTSKYKFAAGSIHSVRLYGKDGEGVHVLGTAPVEPDGSFFVQVSGDQPIQMELLDNKGISLKREAGWFWLRRGEQRACVGCHAGPETAPENAVPMTLLKSTTPADMTRPAHANSAGGH